MSPDLYSGSHGTFKLINCSEFNRYKTNTPPVSCNLNSYNYSTDFAICRYKLIMFTFTCRYAGGRSYGGWHSWLFNPPGRPVKMLSLLQLYLQML